MITLQRRIFSLTAASPSGGAVIFVLQPVFPPFHIYIFPLFISFPAILSAVLYFHILYPPPPLDRHIFPFNIFPAASRPSYIFPYYYLPRRLSAVIYFHIIISPALSAVPYFHIIISPAAHAPADNPPPPAAPMDTVFSCIHLVWPSLRPDVWRP